MKNLKIGKKLFVTFGIIITLFCATVIVSIYSLVDTGNNFSNFYTVPYEVTNRASDLRTSIQAVSKYIGYAMMENDSAITAQYIKSAQDEIQLLREGTSYMKENFTEADSLTQAYDTTMKNIMEDRDKVFDLASKNQNEEAIELYFNKVMPEFIKAQEYLSQINDMAANQATTYYQNAMSQKTIVLVVLAALSISTLAITIFLAFYITRSMTRPIIEIEKAAEEMANGSLNVSINYQSEDELGSLSNSMQALCNGISDIIKDIGRILSALANGDFHIKSNCLQNYIGDYVPILTSMRLIRDNLNTTLIQINQSAEQVASGGEQVSSAAQALSQGATEQASSVEELAATIGEISTQVQTTAKNAIQAHEQTNGASSEIGICNHQMQEMITAMNEINQKSVEIGKIIKTIEDIAFQTNILALNAAVEAARAGTAGKGFAVVADEVRNLASKSAEASKDTAALIADSMESVEKGTKIANETAVSLSRVVNRAQAVANTVEKISYAANEQATSISQVTLGIDQISSVVQTNSATAEQSAAASEELSGQAQILKSLVGRFQLLQDNAIEIVRSSSQIETTDKLPSSLSDSKY